MLCLIQHSSYYWDIYWYGTSVVYHISLIKSCPWVIAALVFIIISSAQSPCISGNRRCLWLVVAFNLYSWPYMQINILSCTSVGCACAHATMHHMHVQLYYFIMIGTQCMPYMHSVIALGLLLINGLRLLIVTTGSDAMSSRGIWSRKYGKLFFVFVVVQSSLLCPLGKPSLSSVHCLI